MQNKEYEKPPLCMCLNKDDFEKESVLYDKKDSKYLRLHCESLEREVYRKYYLEPEQIDKVHGLTIVLDLDETLVSSDTLNNDIINVKIRPFVLSFLASLNNIDCNVILWTAGQKHYVISIIDLVDTIGIIKQIVCRGKWQSKGHVKDLSLLGLDMRKTLMIENSYHCVVSCPYNCIIVDSYIGQADDCILEKLILFIYYCYNCLDGNIYDNVAHIILDYDRIDMYKDGTYDYLVFE